VKKNHAEKRLLKTFLTEDEVLMEVKTLVKKYQSEIFNLVETSPVSGLLHTFCLFTNI